MQDIVIPWFIAFFAGGLFILGFNAINDWKKMVTYTIFDLVMLVFVIVTAFVFVDIIMTVIVTCFLWIALNVLKELKMIGSGDIWALIWTTLGIFMYFNLIGIIIYLLMVWIGNLALVLINRYRGFWLADKVPFIISLFVAFVFSNIILFMFTV